MSFSFPSSGGWDPSSQKTLGWRGSSTRRAGPATEPVAPAARWARLRAAVPVPVPSPETPGSAPPPSFDTQDSALRATQQFQQGEREGQLRSQLDLLTSVSRATRAAIESTASLLRAQNAGAEKKANFLAEEIGKVRRAVHTTDARREISKQGAQTVETVKEVLKSFAVAQEKALGKAIAAISGLDERLKWTEDTIEHIALSQNDISATQKKQDERLRSMGDGLAKLLNCQERQERRAQEERQELRERQTEQEKDFRANRRERNENLAANGEQVIPVPRKRGVSKRKYREFKKYGSAGQKRLLQNGIERNETSISSEEVVPAQGKRKISVLTRDSEVEKKSSVIPRRLLATVCGNSDSCPASQVDVEPNEEEKGKKGGGASFDEEDADSLFLDDSVRKEDMPPESLPLSSPGEAPWMWQSGTNDQDTGETFLSIPLVLRRKRPPRTNFSSGKSKTRRRR